jgi:hypothetical protein
MPILPGVPVLEADDLGLTSSSWLRRRPAAICPAACIGRHEDGASAVTLVTQCSLDRLPRLRVLLSAWGGAASIAVFLDAPESSEASVDGESCVRAMLASLPMAVAARTIVSFGYDGVPKAEHEGSPVPVPETVAPPAARSYPINTLRNLALDNARTELVFLLDVDFVPSASLGTALRARQQALHASLSTSRSAIVVPAFECALAGGGLAGGRGGARLPATKQELESLIDSGDVSLFHVGHFPKGHRATDLARWRQADGAYQVRYEEYFEPYIIASRRFLPRYDERFVGYGLNKVSHLYQCAAEGFSFVVLPGQFVVANEHEKSSSWRLVFGDKRDPTCRRRKQHLAELYRVFKANLPPLPTPPATMAVVAEQKEGGSKADSCGGAKEAKEDVDDSAGTRMMALIDLLNPKGATASSPPQMGAASALSMASRCAAALPLICGGVARHEQEEAAKAQAAPSMPSQAAVLSRQQPAMAQMLRV